MQRDVGVDMQRVVRALRDVGVGAHSVCGSIARAPTPPRQRFRKPSFSYSRTASNLPLQIRCWLFTAAAVPAMTVFQSKTVIAGHDCAGPTPEGSMHDTLIAIHQLHSLPIEEIHRGS